MDLDRLRQLTPERRLRMALEMSEFVREFAKSRLRREHPDWTDAQLMRELTLEMHGLPVPAK
jgi:Rv0078B-related antitoxin